MDERHEDSAVHIHHRAAVGDAGDQRARDGEPGVGDGEADGEEGEEGEWALMGWGVALGVDECIVGGGGGEDGGGCGLVVLEVGVFFGLLKGLGGVVGHFWRGMGGGRGGCEVGDGCFIELVLRDRGICATSMASDLLQSLSSPRLMRQSQPHRPPEAPCTCILVAPTSCNFTILGRPRTVTTAGSGYVWISSIWFHRLWGS